MRWTACSQRAARQHLCLGISVTFSFTSITCWSRHLRVVLFSSPIFSFENSGDSNFHALLTEETHTLELSQTSATYYMRAKEGRQANFKWQYQCRAGNWESSTLKESKASRWEYHWFLYPGKAAVSNSCKIMLFVWLPAFHLSWLQDVLWLGFY